MHWSYTTIFTGKFVDELLEESFHLIYCSLLHSPFTWSFCPNYCWTCNFTSTPIVWQQMAPVYTDLYAMAHGSFAGPGQQIPLTSARNYVDLLWTMNKIHVHRSTGDCHNCLLFMVTSDLTKMAPGHNTGTQSLAVFTLRPWAAGQLEQYRTKSCLLPSHCPFWVQKVWDLHKIYSPLHADITILLTSHSMQWIEHPRLKVHKFF